MVVAVYDENRDWHIASDPFTYLYIEDLYRKFKIVHSIDPEILDSMVYRSSDLKYDFYRIVNLTEYLIKGYQYIRKLSVSIIVTANEIKGLAEQINQSKCLEIVT